MKVAVFLVIFGLYFHENSSVFAQSVDSPIVIEYSATDFVIDRPFTITIIVRDNENRPTIAFPDVPGLVKQGISYSSTRSEINEREVVSQVVTQTYAANAPGTYRLPSFPVTANGYTLRSQGVQLTVRPSPTAPASGTAITAATLSRAKLDKQAAFLKTTVNQARVFTGEGLHIRVSFLVAENYPYEIKFVNLAQQVEAMTRALRPVNAWEENDNISEAKQRPVVLNGRRYVEFSIYSATFFPLATRTGVGRTIAIPPVPLTVNRQSVAIPLPGNAQTAKSKLYREVDNVTFRSEPIKVVVQPLPTRGAVGPVSVGTFRLVSEADRSRVAVGQSIRYDIRIEGQGNIASIQAPQLISAADLDVFPPQAQEQVGRTGEAVSGHKSFRYFLIPKQKGTVPLAKRFFWVYFDPQIGRYDTLRPTTVLRVGEAADSLAAGIVPSDTLDQVGRPSIYAGLEQTDSTAQSVNWPVLIRAIANVLIVIMILGTLFVFARK